MIAVLLAAGCRPPAAPAVPVAVPPAAAAPDALYFLMVDRFADGRPDAPGTVDPADPQGWHGGDVQGVIDHLDHLESLGVGGVWLTPLTDCQDRKVDAWGAFHCYWVDDLARPEPRLGTLDEVRALSDALHERGMTLTLDMVYNHLGYDSPVLAAHPDWVHGLGDIEDWDDPVEVVTHDVHGLPDLAQEQEEVYAWLRDASLVWLDAVQPDGIRVDAVRHLPEGFLARLGDELRAASERDLVLLGEVFEGDAEVLAARQRADRLDRVFDFPLHYAMTDVFCDDASLGRLGSVLSLDRGYDDPSALVTFLDNHDVPRIQSACHGEDARVERALAFQLTARGRPSLTWGTEVAVEGPEEPANRPDMPWEAVDGHPRVQLVRDLLALRRRHPELAAGDSRVVRLDDEVLGVLRTAGEGATLIVVNRSGAPVSEASSGTVRSAWAVVDGALVTGLDAVPAGAVGGLVLAGATAPEAGPVELALSVDAPLAEGEHVVLVGAGADLGSWDPSRGVSPDDDGVVRLTVPAGAVLAFKLVVIGPEGARWEERPDRYLLAGGLPPSTLVWGR